MQQKHVAIVGAGFIARWHLQALEQISGVKVIAICDLDYSKARDLAEEFYVEGVYSSIESMLDQENVDIAHVLLPPKVHGEVTAYLRSKGCSVLLEKPLAIPAAHAEQLVERGVSVSHNFLFSPIYQRLKKDILRGMLGPIRAIDIQWSKELPLSTSWLKEDTANAILEVGPHSVAHMLDLMGDPDEVETFREGRQWRVFAKKEGCTAALHWNLGPGPAMHRIYVQGRVASAEVDFENNSYLLDRDSKYGPDFHRLRRGFTHSWSTLWQASWNFCNYILSKMKLSGRGNAFGESIYEALSAYYRGSHGLEASFGARVVHWTEAIAKPKGQPPKEVHRGKKEAEILLLGGTGFIGRALCRRLLAQGKSVAVLTRDPAKVLPQDNLEVVVGDFLKPEDVERAVKGRRVVYHLARTQASTWESYYQRDVLPTQFLGELVLKYQVQRLVYTGSIASYDAAMPGREITETSGHHPHIKQCNPYARSKAFSEDVLVSQRLPLVIVRPGIVVGQGSSPQHWGVGMWKGETVCQLWGSGKNPLPFVLLDDVVDALLKTGELPGIEGQSYNLIGDVRLSGLQYLSLFERIAKVKLSILPTAIWKFYLIDLMKWGIKVAIRHPGKSLVPLYSDWAARTHRSTYSNVKAKEELNWYPVKDEKEFIARGIEEPCLEWMS